MANLRFSKEITALLVIDPYNDFISEGGKIWDRIKTVAEANNCVPNMLQILKAARQTELRIFYAMHHRYRPGDYETCSTLRLSKKQLGREDPSNMDAPCKLASRPARILNHDPPTTGILIQTATVTL